MATKALKRGCVPISESHGSVLRKLWDYEKNNAIGIKPKNISRGSDIKVWWKCKEHGSYQQSVKSKFVGFKSCPKCSSTVSKPNKIIAYYLKKAFPRIVLEKNIAGKRFDIYVPSVKLVVEYDGGRWHQNAEKDRQKCEHALNNKLNIIRIREGSCPDLNMDCVIQLQQDSRNRSPQYFLELEEAIKELLSLLGKDVPVNLSEDLPKILGG
ncbi:DUF4379 containing protein [Listeria phage LP-125]|uniref:DUF4379 containing protein n=3 Tax=Pecentumvirus TaxID=1857844 RepID=S4U820_9CAUD|nr:DUF4379 containing protein [Listeria phage LP-125]YP_009592589.1 DUF4379 domain-containing protein [Listeria phage LP-064]AGI11379.1 DUF4379 containing protein [Listeria phage LP-125]AHL19080.1 DUF4379 domain-containing protein [Listeria phage LP-064]QNL32003.1 hypothetical protein HUK30_0041 [Listeria phage LP-Mix_6.2]